MKLESFERATAIKTEIDKLTSLSKVLCQAAQGDYNIGAVRKDCYGHWEIMSEAFLSQEMLVAFNGLLSEKVKVLREEFESL
jgi:hypothetical protein